MLPTGGSPQTIAELFPKDIDSRGKESIGTDTMENR